MKYLCFYLALINLALLCVMGADKLRAKRHRRRVPERTLLALAVLGGSVGGMLGMLLFRHKTRHAKFFLGFPLIFLCEAALVYVLFFR